MAESEKRGFLGRLFGRKQGPAGPLPADAGPERREAGVGEPQAAGPPAAIPDGQDADQGADWTEAAAEAIEVGRIVEAAEPPLVPLPSHPEPLGPADLEAAEAPPEPVEPAAAPWPGPDTGPEASPAEPGAEAPKLGWLSRLKRGLARSSQSLGESVAGLFTKRKLDAATLEELEDALIQADLGVETAMAITERLGESRYQKGISEDELRGVLAEEVEARLKPVALPLDLDRGRRPHVVLVVGVNGSGKTTTIGKIAARLARDGKSVMMAAGDTFRAAAVEQLKIWGERTGAPVIVRPTGSDAAGLVFDALTAAREAGTDVLLVDTAGRLQNRGELMAELEKVVRVIRKQDATAPHDVLLVLDATTGQNALQQVEIFGRVAGVTGLVMTKLDGTARGGILVAIAAKHRLPVHFIGVGEGIDDLSPFDARDFARAIAGFDD